MHNSYQARQLRGERATYMNVCSWMYVCWYSMRWESMWWLEDGVDKRTEWCWITKTCVCWTPTVALLPGTVSCIWMFIQQILLLRVKIAGTSLLLPLKHPASLPDGWPPRGRGCGKISIPVTPGVAMPEWWGTVWVWIVPGLRRFSAARAWGSQVFSTI